MMIAVGKQTNTSKIKRGREESVGHENKKTVEKKVK
jgi:hypothetical protein